MRRQSLLFKGYLGLIYLLLYIPIIILILYSFNHATYTMQWRGFTWDWYIRAFQDSLLWRCVFNSLCLATLSATLASLLAMTWVVATFDEYSLLRRRVNDLLVLLVVIPDIVLAIALLVFFHFMGSTLGFFTLLCAHTTMALPISVLVLQQRMDNLEHRLLEASLDLGASMRFTFRVVLMPLLLSALTSSWLLSFTLSLDDFLVSYFVSGPGYPILPLYIYGLIRSGIKPEINALCSLVFFASLIMVSMAYFLIRKDR